MDTTRRALLWEALDKGAVRCGLCNHRCRIPSGKAGLCGVRENSGGELRTLVYGRLVAENVDPIEKKPLFHVAPGSLSYSVATAGCNLSCAHCQNYSISQVPRQRGRIPGTGVTAASVVERAVSAGCRSIAYTYTEPTVFFEYALDCMGLARKAGLLNLFVSNGYMTPECLELAAPLLDGINVDLKSFSDDFYRTVCGARLQPVLDNLRLLHELGVWVEVTTLVIPNRNDGEDELRAIARFLASVDVEIPWHVTGFFPTYRLTDEPPTPVATLQRAREIGLSEGLHHVYAGNRSGSGGENTQCHGCGRLLIARRGFLISHNHLTPGGSCADCGTPLAGVEIGGTP